MLVAYYRNVPAASPTGPAGARADYSIGELDRPAPPERSRPYRDGARRDRTIAAEPVAAASPKGRKRAR
jgi:hypothetical protein